MNYYRCNNKNTIFKKQSFKWLIMVLRCSVLGGGTIIYVNCFFIKFSLNVALSLFHVLHIFNFLVLSLLNIRHFWIDSLTFIAHFQFLKYLDFSFHSFPTTPFLNWICTCSLQNCDGTQYFLWTELQILKKATI